MLAAFLEWFLWLAAFLYCLCKVYAKAENISVKILALIMMVLFTLLRYVEWQPQLLKTRTLTLPPMKKLLTDAQMHLPPNHDRHPSSASTSHQILPICGRGISTMVCVLVLRRPSYHTMAVLRVPAGDELGG